MSEKAHAAPCVIFAEDSETLDKVVAALLEMLQGLTTAGNPCIQATAIAQSIEQSAIEDAPFSRSL